jgi:hypothetical protein
MHNKIHHFIFLGRLAMSILSASHGLTPCLSYSLKQCCCLLSRVATQIYKVLVDFARHIQASTKRVLHWFPIEVNRDHLADSGGIFQSLGSQWIEPCCLPWQKCSGKTMLVVQGTSTKASKIQLIDQTRRQMW